MTPIEAIPLLIGVATGAGIVIGFRYLYILGVLDEDDEHAAHHLSAPQEERSLSMLVVYTLGAIVFTIIALVPICNAQSASDDAAELQALRAELEREREARRQAEADAAEALAIAREAMEEADAAFVAPLLVGAPTQRVPSSGAVVYVDQLPPGVAVEDTIRFESSDDRGWLVLMLGNELPSLPLNGQQPFPMAVAIDGVNTTVYVVPPGSTGYVVPDRSSYEVIRLVRFEGSAFSASGLRFAGVKFVRDRHAHFPHGRLLTDWASTAWAVKSTR